MRILIWTSTYGKGPDPRMRQSVETQVHTHQTEWVIDREQAYPPPDHRNVLSSYRRATLRALEGYDALLIVEHDMILPSHAIRALANTPGDVGYGVYLFRWGGYVLNAFEYIGDRNIGESLSLHRDKARRAREQGLVRVSGAGWGCTLLRRSALEAIPFPEEHPENPCFDVAFAQRAVRAGLELWADFDVLCGHIKDDTVLWPFRDFMEKPITHNGAAIMMDGQLLPMYGFEIDGRATRMTEIRPFQTLHVQIERESWELLRDQVYVLDAMVAEDLARAGLVDIL